MIPMQSWGTLPMNYVDVWRSRGCDLVFSAQRMGSRPLSNCLNHLESRSNQAGPYLSTTTITTTTSLTQKEKSLEEHPNMRKSLPLIAIMAATTTRKVKKPTLKNLSLFTYLLPSLIRYTYVIAKIKDKLVM